MMNSWCSTDAKLRTDTTTLYAERPEAFGKPTPKAKPPARKPPPAVSHNAVPWQMKRVGGGYRENPNAELSNAYSTIDRLVAENAKLSAALQSCSGEKAALAASIAASEAALRHAHLREGATSKTLQAAQAELAEKATNWESLLSSRSSKLRGLEEAQHTLRVDLNSAREALGQAQREAAAARTALADREQRLASAEAKLATVGAEAERARLREEQERSEAE